MKPKKILLLAILSGVITTILFYVFINESAATKQTQQEIEKVKVVAMTQGIAKDQKVTSDILVLKEIPIDQFNKEMIKNLDDAVNQYTTTEMKQGEIVMYHRLQNKEAEKEMVSRKINEEYRGVSIAVTYVTGISNLIHPEDYVDVILWKETGETELILQKVRVLAVGERMSEKKQDGTEELYQAVTLELNQEDTVDMVGKDGQGELRLALYSKSDLKDVTVKHEKEKTKESVEMLPNEIVTVPALSVIRKAPNLEAEPWEIVKKETTLRPLNKQEKDEDGRTWIQVETSDQKEGWISNRIIKNSDE